MNDPFDGCIDDLFDVELKDHYNGAVVTLVDMLSRNPGEFAKRIVVPLEEVIANSATLNAGTVAQRDQMLAFLTSSMIDDLSTPLSSSSRMSRATMCVGSMPKPTIGTSASG